jgi:hypothetical protein
VAYVDQIQGFPHLVFLILHKELITGLGTMAHFHRAIVGARDVDNTTQPEVLPRHWRDNDGKEGVEGIGSDKQEL